MSKKKWLKLTSSPYKKTTIDKANHYLKRNKSYSKSKIVKKGNRYIAYVWGKPLF